LLRKFPNPSVPSSPLGFLPLPVFFFSLFRLPTFPSSAFISSAGVFVSNRCSFPLGLRIDLAHPGPGFVFQFRAQTLLFWQRFSFTTVFACLFCPPFDVFRLKSTFYQHTGFFVILGLSNSSLPSCPQLSWLTFSLIRYVSRMCPPRIFLCHLPSCFGPPPSLLVRGYQVIYP